MKTKDSASVKTKDLGLSVKLLDEDGTFEGYGSIFGNVDSYGDKVMPGSFAKSLAKHEKEGTKVKMLWQHQSTEPIGVWDELKEDRKGLFGKGRLLLELTKAREVHIMLKNSIVDGLSIGYREVKVTPVDNIRQLDELDLYEISPVTFPANRRARVTGVKSEQFEEFARRLRDGDPPPIKEFEDILREAGIPKSMATAIASHGYAKAIRSDSEGGEANDKSVDFLRSLLKTG